MVGKQPLRAPQIPEGAAKSNLRVVLSVAGFDPSSGAGATADLQTFAAHGLFGTCALTALTVQSTIGVFEVQSLDAGLLQRTMETLWEDLPPQGIKVGMLASKEIVQTVAVFLRALGRRRPPVVFDPVLRSSSGRELLSQAGIESLQRELLPVVDWLTPNWAELSLLSGHEIMGRPGAEQALARLGEAYPHLAIVATGGEAETPVDMLRLPDGVIHVFTGRRVDTPSTHGTGCAFSSALLALLVRGRTAVDAVAEAKHFVEGALRSASPLGRGRGPMNLLWPLQEQQAVSARLGFE